MKQLSSSLFQSILLAGILLGFFLPPFTHAQSASGAVINSENVYLLAEDITLKTLSEKDVFALGSDVVIDAPVKGDLQVFAKSVTVKAPVSGDIRIAAGEILIENAHIDGDMLLAGGSVIVDKAVSSSGSTMIFAATTVFEGSTGKMLIIKGSDTQLGGRHQGIVEVSSPILKILDTFIVGGSLKYATGSEVEVKPGTVQGKIMKENIQREETSLWDRVGTALSTFLSLFIGLLILIWTYPADLVRRVHLMKTSPLSSFVKGFLGGIILPFILIILSMTVIGFPLVVALMFAYFAVIFVSPLFAVMYMGSLVMPNAADDKKSLLKIALIGSIISTFILQIPVLGVFIMILLSALAFGTFLRKREPVL